MVHFFALPKLPSAAETADLLISQVVRLHGIPQNIVSDRGPQFTSGVWKAFCRRIAATVNLSSGYHPQTNGQAERANQALEATLRCVTTSNPASWSLHLPWVFPELYSQHGHRLISVYVFPWLPTSSLSFPGDRGCGAFCSGASPSV